MKKLFSFLTLGFITLFFVSAKMEEGYQVGDTVADFKLKNIDGSMLSLSDAKFADKKGVMVIFSCNHCPYVVAYEDRMIALQEKYGTEIPIIAVNPNSQTHAEDSFEAMQKRAAEKGFKFDYLEDAEQTVAKTFGATRTPHVYLLKREGASFVVSYIGAIDNNHKDAAAVTEKYLENAIEALKNGSALPADKQVTKAVGCTIKWKQS
ncbi:MAG TPA: thioredoxin family protein [Microscillaceae bacterium]|jgi:peroxiredoxin|nr:thioredoxin family protein [Microscillaceae bacterium]